MSGVRTPRSLGVSLPFQWGWARIFCSMRVLIADFHGAQFLTRVADEGGAGRGGGNGGGIGTSGCPHRPLSGVWRCRFSFGQHGRRPQPNEEAVSRFKVVPINGSAPVFGRAVCDPQAYTAAKCRDWWTEPHVGGVGAVEDIH